MSTILVKVGGAQLEQADGRATFATAVREATDAGHRLILVHGGGNQIRALSDRLGIADRYHHGLRVTDAETAEVVLMVLGGAVNRRLVWALESVGVRAVGLTGADGSSYLAAPHRPDGHDLGFVGQLSELRPDLIALLAGHGYVPVLATSAPGAGDGPRDAPFFNVNADMAVAAIGRAISADVLLFLTDVPGVLDAGGALVPRLTSTDCAALTDSGAVAGGMRPKLDAALGALRSNPGATVKIAPAAGPHAILAALDPSVGTTFAGEEAIHG